MKENIFYKVEYNGSIHKYEIVDYKDDKPIYAVTRLTSFIDDEYILENNNKPYGEMKFPLKIIMEDKNYFTDYEEALIESKKRFDKIVNPNGKYRVGRHFDDVFECWVTKVLTKKEAKKQQKNFENGYYVSYRVHCVDNE